MLGKVVLRTILDECWRLNKETKNNTSLDLKDKWIENKQSDTFPRKEYDLFEKLFMFEIFMLYMSIGCYFKRIKSSDVVGASGWSWLVWLGWDGNSEDGTR